MMIDDGEKKIKRKWVLFDMNTGARGFMGGSSRASHTHFLKHHAWATCGIRRLGTLYTRSRNVRENVLALR